MTEDTAQTPPQKTTAEPVHARPIHKRLEIILALIFILSAVGIGITDFSQKLGYMYWVYATPVLGVFSFIAHWSQREQKHQSSGTVIGIQILHWLGLFLGIVVIFLLEKNGRINNPGAGLAALLSVALATFLAGNHSGWHFFAAGAVLGLVVVLAAFVEEFLWLIPLGALLLLLIVSWFRRRRHRRAQNTSAETSP